jgi:PadR family transcriptional regulator, regulatory protein PadR
MAKPATNKKARKISPPASGKSSAAAARKAAHEARRVAEAGATGFAPAGRPSDVFGGELRRRDIFSLLVLHLISRSEGGASYGNQLIEEIEGLTRGIVSVNPNTMYPLLRELESRDLVSGYWEHPEKRSRRLYSVTPAGKSEYERLMGAMEPFLDSIVESITLIKREVYGNGPGSQRRA